MTAVEIRRHAIDEDNLGATGVWFWARDIRKGSMPARNTVILQTVAYLALYYSRSFTQRVFACILAALVYDSWTLSVI